MLRPPKKPDSFLKGDCVGFPTLLTAKCLGREKRGSISQRVRSYNSVFQALYQRRQTPRKTTIRKYRMDPQRTPQCSGSVVFRNLAWFFSLFGRNAHLTNMQPQLRIPGRLG